MNLQFSACRQRAVTWQHAAHFDWSGLTYFTKRLGSRRETEDSPAING